MTKNELSQRTVPELKALAKELGIAVKGRRKDDIIAEILKPGGKAAPAAGRKSPGKPEKAARKAAAKKAPSKAAKKAAPPEKKPPVRAAGKAVEKPEKAAKPGRKIAAKKAPPTARARAVAPAPSYQKKDLAEKTVLELKALAKKLGIVVKGRRKDDIIAGMEEAAKRLGAEAPPKGRIKPAPEVAARPRVRVERPAPPSAAKPSAAKPSAAKPSAAKLAPAKPAPAKPAAAKPVAAKPAPPRKKPVMERAVSAPKAPEGPRRPVPPVQAGERPFVKPRSYDESGAVMPSAPSMREAPAEEAVVDRLAAIVVDPRQIFVSWQLRGAALREGVPAIRVYDSTGVAFSAKRAGSFFDLPLHAASGSAYVDVVPGRELFVALGVTGPGGVFSPVRTTGRLFVPREKAPEGRAILPEQYFTFRPPHY